MEGLSTAQNDLRRGGTTRLSKTSSQSPRANRDSTQDPLEHAKGSVQFDNFKAPESKSDPIDDRAWEHLGGKTTSQKDI